jgi:transcriptional regulator with XRE-family HTH domain
MDTFGKRLKDARTKLGMTQEAFGQACGRKNIMQMKYEKDQGFPDVPYLLQAAALGIDLNFLITGRHGSSEPDAAEALLLNAWRAQSSEGKAAVLGTLLGLAGAQGQATRAGALPAQALREWRTLATLRTCTEVEQTVFEEFARNLAQKADNPSQNTPDPAT